MVKVMWFLKRAEHLTLEQFTRWWIERHAPDIVADQQPYLKRYKIDARVADDAEFAGRPEAESPWDGIAEQWFDSVDAYNAVYRREDRPTRADTLAHTSRFERLVVMELEVPVGTGPRS